MKKIITFLIITALIIPNMVFAQEETPYFTNLNGATLTREQYEYLIQYHTYDELYTASVGLINYMTSGPIIDFVEEKKFIRVDTYFDENWKVEQNIETEITEQEMENYLNSPAVVSEWDYHETNMKVINMTITRYQGVSGVSVTINNTWKTIPSVKSFDVIGLRPENVAPTTQVNGTTISAYQKWDGNIINYGVNSENTKYSTLNSGQGGVGISMNISDNVTSSLEMQLTAVFLTEDIVTGIHGTYQHATSDVTLNESKSYSFHNEGLGQVFYYSNPAIRSKYDNTTGLYVDYIFEVN